MTEITKRVCYPQDVPRKPRLTEIEIMRTLKIFIMAAAVALSAASCTNPHKVSVSQPVTLDMETASKWTVTCRVTNCSAHRVTVGEARLTLHYRDAKIGTVILAEPVTVAKCSENDVAIPVRVKITNDPLALLSLASLRELPSDELYVTGEAVLKSGIGRKKIRFDRHPLSEILTNFAPSGIRLPL